MKGLLIKDFSLMKMQKKFFIVVAALAVVMSFSMDDPEFVAGYMTFVIPMFALSTISYDEFDNGNAFLFTLPVSRKGYVAEKYCFCILLGVFSLILNIVLSLCVGIVIEPIPILETFIGTLLRFFVLTAVLAIMLPLQLKYGSEKGRIAMFAVIGIFFLIGLSTMKLAELFQIDLPSAINSLFTMKLGMILAGTAVLAVLVVLVSMKISIVIMEKKEF